MISYIYIRIHTSYDNACKLGKANNIPDRDSQYATGEIKRGYFHSVFEVPIQHVCMIERLLQFEFKHFNIKHDAGTEFYHQDIIPLIEPYFILHNINYKKLSSYDIDNLVRCNRVKRTFKKLNIHSIIHTLKSLTKKTKNKYQPRPEQQIIIEHAINHYQSNDKGLLIIPCGTGKTLISLWITQKLNSSTILIGVPNTKLLEQWEEKTDDLFKDIPHLIVSGSIDFDYIIQFLKTNSSNCIVITTYSSAHKVYTASNAISFIFDMKINDECHHLTTSNMELSHTTKKYIQMLNIPSNKQLSLTATIKDSEDEMVISNRNTDYFGNIIDQKCLLWAITQNIVCDYVIQTIITHDNFNIDDEIDKRLFLSAFASLKSIMDGNSHHLLIYSNNKENSLKIIQYITMILDQQYFNIPMLYYSNYHSEMKSKDQKIILDKFEKSTFGIITCVYCLGEGWDFPLLDGVVFAENMTSNIRIVQSALRASRKNENQTDKITKIILPILNQDDWLDNHENTDLKKVRKVIYQMGLEDETISQKIKVFKMGIVKHNPTKDKIVVLGEYDDALTQTLRLKTIGRNALDISYEKAKRIIAEKGIKNKEAYYELCEQDIRLSKEPDILYKGQFTNWIDYLSIERIYYDLPTCKQKVNDYLKLYPELKKHYLNLSIIIKELLKLDNKFPPNGLWTDYYNISDLNNIIIIFNKKKKSGVIL